MPYTISSHSSVPTVYPAPLPPALFAALLGFISFACGMCVCVCVWIAPGLQFALFYRLHMAFGHTHTRTQLAADPAHTHTCTGRPFLSSCRSGRVPNDIFYTLFFWASLSPFLSPSLSFSASFRSISHKARGRIPKQTSFIQLHPNSPHLTSAQLNCRCRSLCLAAAASASLPLPLPRCPVNWFPFGSCCCRCFCCWAQFSVFVWQVHEIIDRRGTQVEQPRSN